MQSHSNKTPPTLEELPAPPSGKTGWPWTEQSDPLPKTQSNGEPWPKTSIVTPSYNQGQFIEETIRSVLLQGYPNLEYIIIDGNSTDGTVDILKKYDSWIDHWVSERDGGQTEALNRGFESASGEILGWLNSDDVYCPGALSAIAATFEGSRSPRWVTGHCIGIDENGGVRKLYRRDEITSTEDWVRRLLSGSTYALAQPATFWRQSAWAEFGPLDESFDFIFDHDLFLQIFQRYGTPVYIDHKVAKFRHHNASKTSTQKAPFDKERARVGLKHAHHLPFLERVAAPIKSIRTQARLTLFEAIDLAESSDRDAALSKLWSAVRRYPPLLFCRPLWGFVRRRLTGEHS